MAALDAVTLPEVKGALGIDGTAEDEMLVRLITATTLEIERRLRTQFVQRAVVEYREGGSKRIYPGVIPIVSITSIADPAGNTVGPTLYVIRQQRWLEAYGHFNQAFAVGGQMTDWTITYVAGWFANTTGVAADVKAEVIRAIGGLREAPAAGVSSVGVGDLSVSYSAPVGVDGEAAPAVAAAVASLTAYQGVLL